MSTTVRADAAQAVARPAGGLERVLRRAALCFMGFVVITDLGIVHGLLRAAAFRLSILAPHGEGGVESTVFQGIPSLWLQHWIPERIGALPAAALWWSLFYLPTMLALGVLMVFGRRHFFRLALLYAVLLVSADGFYALAPTRPPWVDYYAIHRIIADYAAPLVLADNNPLAAVPSLHVAVPALWAMWFCHHEDARMRTIGRALVVWTVAMLWAVVYTGEQYVLGAFAGLCWAILVYAVMDRLGLAQARRARASSRVAMAEDAPESEDGAERPDAPPRPMPPSETKAA